MNDLMVVEKLVHCEKLKTLVFDSVSSPITKRVYNMALNEFLAWFQQAPRPGFTKAIRMAGHRHGTGCIAAAGFAVPVHRRAIRRLGAVISLK